MDKENLYKELKIKEAEVKDLVDVINQVNSNNLDIDKLYEVSHVKAEASQLLEERDELKIRLSEVEGAHSLLEGMLLVFSFPRRRNLYIYNVSIFQST